jgi:hypothetical protein
VINGIPFGLDEPTVIYEANPHIVGTSPCFKIWFSQGGIKYTESTDGIGWALTSGLPILTTPNNYGQSSVFHSGSTYYMTANPNPNHDGSQIDLLESSDGQAFTLVQAGIISTGAAGAWDSLSVYNSSLVIEGNNGYLMYEAKGDPDPSIFAVGLATSTAPFTSWIKSSHNPILGAGVYAAHPDLHHVNGSWYAWVGRGNFNSLKRISSSTFDSAWTDSDVATYSANTSDETSQTADDFLVEVNGKSYLYYIGIRNAPKLPDHLKLAIANMPLSELVGTNEGVIKTAGQQVGKVVCSGAFSQQ